MKKSILFGSLFLLLFCIGISALVYLYLFSNSTAILNTYQMDGASMEPTFSDGDTFSVEPDFVTINRGDIVVIEKDGASYIKRVIALPGETIEFIAGEVYIDGQVLDEPYLATNSETMAAQGESSIFTLSSGQYFVMGDNRVISLDSRHTRFGLVDINEISGVYYLED